MRTLFALSLSVTVAASAIWFDADVHAAAVVSLVDCSSFEVMRRRGIVRAFHFYRHFSSRGSSSSSLVRGRKGSFLRLAA